MFHQTKIECSGVKLLCNSTKPTLFWSSLYASLKSLWWQKKNTTLYRGHQWSVGFFFLFLFFTYDLNASSKLVLPRVESACLCSVILIIHIQMYEQWAAGSAVCITNLLQLHNRICSDALLSAQPQCVAEYAWSNIHACATGTVFIMCSIKSKSFQDETRCAQPQRHKIKTDFCWNWRIEFDACCIWNLRSIYIYMLFYSHWWCYCSSINIECSCSRGGMKETFILHANIRTGVRHTETEGILGMNVKFIKSNSM